MRVGTQGKGLSLWGTWKDALPTLPYLEIPKRSLGASTGHKKLCLRLPGEREGLVRGPGQSWEGDKEMEAKGFLGPTNALLTFLG